METRRNRTFQALLLAVLGLFLLERVWSGKILLYINQRFVILVVLAGIGLIALAQAVFMERGQKADPEPEPEGGEPAHPGHAHGPKAQLIWLLVPLAFGLLIPARSLNASSLANRGVQLAAPFQVQARLSTAALETPSGNRTVLDWIRAFAESGDPQGLVNEPADLIGFVYHDPRLQPGQFLVGRYTVACCIADAAAIGLVVNWKDAAALQTNTWVRVKGAIRVGQLDGQRVPELQADQVSPIPEPDQPYLFP